VLSLDNWQWLVAEAMSGPTPLPLPIASAAAANAAAAAAAAAGAAVRPGRWLLLQAAWQTMSVALAKVQQDCKQLHRLLRAISCRPLQPAAAEPLAGSKAATLAAGTDSGAAPSVAAAPARPGTGSGSNGAADPVAGGSSSIAEQLAGLDDLAAYTTAAVQVGPRVRGRGS